MKIINPSYEILTPISEGGKDELRFIERVARVCYKSETKIVESCKNTYDFVRMLIHNGHESMLEHSQLSVLFICDRGVSHEIVRHRMASFAQESTRYCNYSNGRFDNEITVIRPSFFTNIEPDYVARYLEWLDSCSTSELQYMTLIRKGALPEEARTVLPNSLKTELVMTANYREWRHFFKLRTDIMAHPQMRELACPLLDELVDKIPVIFDDLKQL